LTPDERGPASAKSKTTLVALDDHPAAALLEAPARGWSAAVRMAPGMHWS
jgi:hypothetical protein